MPLSTPDQFRLAHAVSPDGARQISDAVATTQVSGDITNTAITTVGDGALTAASVAGGLITRSGSTAAYTDTLATAALIIAALPGMAVGQSFLLTIRNTVAFQQTIATAVGITLSGNVVIPGFHVGQFLVTIASSTTLTIIGLGAYPQIPLPSSKFATDPTGTQTAPAGALTGANHVDFQNTATGAVALTVRTAAQMFADIPNAQIGFSWLLTIISQADNTVTLTADAGPTVTLTGTMTIATKTTRTFVCTFTSATALTIRSINKGTIE